MEIESSEYLVRSPLPQVGFRRLKQTSGNGDRAVLNGKTANAVENEWLGKPVYNEAIVG